MKIKTLYICIGILFVVVLTLSLYIMIPNPCNRLHLDDNLKLFASKDAVPNEETARKIADIVIAAQMEKNGEKRFDAEEYNVNINFNEKDFKWELDYLLISPDGYHAVGGGVHIAIRKDCGMIINMYFTK